jgi:hypothetical protein
VEGWYYGDVVGLRVMQYITDETGDRVGVVLDWATYQRLLGRVPPELSRDPELLVGLSEGELSVLAKVSLALEVQAELSQLLRRQDRDGLSAVERVRLDEILEEVDRLNLLKARARYTLRSLRLEAAA